MRERWREENLSDLKNSKIISEKDIGFSSQKGNIDQINKCNKLS
jgi:hypothetical protein